MLDPDQGGLKPFCSVRWSSIVEEDTQDNNNNSQLLLTMYKVYCVVLVLLEYAAPLFIISMAYLRMGIKLWGQETPGHADTARDDMILRNKKKVGDSCEDDVLIMLCWQVQFFQYLILLRFCRLIF